MRVLADRVYWAMRARGMTQRRLAEESGVSMTMVGRIVTDRSNPTAPNIVKLARTLGVSADWLLGLEE